MGISESLFGLARADVTKSRPLLDGRRDTKTVRISAAREALDNWILRQRDQMEGDKLTGARWFSKGKITQRELWERYMTECAIVQV